MTPRVKSNEHKLFWIDLHVAILQSMKEGGNAYIKPTSNY